MDPGDLARISILTSLFHVIRDIDYHEDHSAREHNKGTDIHDVWSPFQPILGNNTLQGAVCHFIFFLDVDYQNLAIVYIIADKK